MALQVGIATLFILSSLPGANAGDRDPVVPRAAQPTLLQQEQDLPRAQRRATNGTQNQQQRHQKLRKLQKVSKYNPKTFSSKCKKQGPR
jgi:hypothetical protein